MKERHNWHILRHFWHLQFLDIAQKPLYNKQRINYLRQEDLTVKNYSFVHIIELYHTYKGIDGRKKDDFYQHKCDYYQFFVKMILILASLASLSYLVSDYQLNGNTIMPTLIPRTSILVPMTLYIFLESKVKSYRWKELLNYLLLNMIVFATIWAVYHLEIKTHFSEGATIMNLIFLICCLGASPKSGLLGYCIFFAQILISHQINHYENLDVILSLNIPCFVGITFAHYLLNLGEFEHYLTAQKLEEALITDPLTTVYNRHRMNQLIEDNQIISDEEQISLIMLDIDFFKNVNDTFGHYAGDQVLRYLGTTLMKEIPENGTVIRFGGEEFIIILPGWSPENAYGKAEEIRRKIAASEECPVKFHISAGVVEYNGNFQKSIRAADHALYHAKETGRNRVFWDREF